MTRRVFRAKEIKFQYADEYMLEQVKFYSLDQLNDIAVYRAPGPIQSLALSPDDTHAAVGLTNGAVHVLKLGEQGGVNAEALPLLAIPHKNSDGTPQYDKTAPVVALSFSLDGTQLAASVRDGTVSGTYMSLSPFTRRAGPYANRSVGVVSLKPAGFFTYCPYFI